MLLQTGMYVLMFGTHEQNYDEILTWCKHRVEVYIDPNGGFTAVLGGSSYKSFCEKFDYDFVDRDALLIERGRILERAHCANQSLKR